LASSIASFVLPIPVVPTTEIKVLIYENEFVFLKRYLLEDGCWEMEVKNLIIYNMLPTDKI